MATNINVYSVGGNPCEGCRGYSYFSFAIFRHFRFTFAPSAC